jgi:hypothetical protein
VGRLPLGRILDGMTRPARVIVGTGDGTRALAWGIAEARRRGAELRELRRDLKQLERSFS